MENPTVADLLAGGLRLGLTCGDCGRFRYLRLDRMSAQTVIDDLAQQLACSRCRSAEVALRPVQRDRRTGFWPAESG